MAILSQLQYVVVKIILVDKHIVLVRLKRNVSFISFIAEICRFEEIALFYAKLDSLVDQ